MQHVRFSIARLLGVIVVCGIILAGLRSGSNDWFKSIYTLAFITLVYAAIRARFRGPSWYGFAVAGWAYFLVGFGPWIGSPSGSEPLRAANRNLVTSVVVEIVSGTFSATDRLSSNTNAAAAAMFLQNREANRDGICHCALTVLIALAGGVVATAVARRPRTDG
jgi:hypothetical protein